MKKHLWILSVLLISAACSPATLEHPFTGTGKPSSLTDYWSVSNNHDKNMGLLVFASANDAYYATKDTLKSNAPFSPIASTKKIVEALHPDWHYTNLQCVELRANTHACTTNLEGDESLQNMLGIYQTNPDGSISWLTPKPAFLAAKARKHNLSFELTKDASGNPSNIHFNATESQMVDLLKSIPTKRYVAAFNSPVHLTPLDEFAARREMLRILQSASDK